MNIAVVKPDYRISGGFEIAMDKIISGLRSKGHTVTYIKVDMTDLGLTVGRTKIPPAVFQKNPEYFRYVIAVDKFAKLDLHEYDLVLCTQPPSFAVQHPRIANIFYHHQRVFYDLSDLLIETAMVDRDIHRISSEMVREIDRKYMTDDILFIAGSEHIATRLRRFNQIDAGAILRIGISENYYNYDGPIHYEEPIYVGRHEFPKRPELFIHALKHTSGVTGRIVGEGGRTKDLMRVNKLLTYYHDCQIPISDEQLWKTVMTNLDDHFKPEYDRVDDDHSVVFTGKLTESELIDEYARALCIVCPSYDEDYGLTPIEAMAFHKPAIVCKDGGGYAETIQDGVTGFVVDPTAEAIAEKVMYLKSNPEVAKKMGENAYIESRQYNWTDVYDKLNNVLINYSKKKLKE